MYDCPYCKDTGYTNKIRNPVGFYTQGDEPVTEKVPCEYCGGEGE